MLAQKIALINMKGGVGKSTLTANLAWEIATEPWNKRVLVIDLDPQFNCSQYLLGAGPMEGIIDNEKATVWDVFEQNTTVPGRPRNALDPIEVVTSVFNPIRGSGSIDLMPSRLELSQTLRNPTSKEHLLNLAVKRLENDYDVVLIDCAPTESMLTTAAYMVVNHILVPVRPEFLSTIGLPLLEQSINEFEATYPGKTPEVLGLVFNAISNYSPEENTSKSDVRRVARQSNWPIFDAEVRYSRSYPKSAREGAPIFGTSYVHSTTKRNFHAFAREFADRISL